MFHVEQDMKTYNPTIKVKDHSVTGESFELLYDASRALLYTHPKPSDSALKDYYPTTNYISHTNQRRSLFDFLYHAVRYVSTRRKLRLIKPFQPKQATLLDVGAGTGYFSRAAQKKGWTVTGIEPNSSARRLANSKAIRSVFDTSKLHELPKKSFDVITLWHVLEHLPNLEEDIKLFHKLLKPNGRIVVAVPNFKSFDAIYFKAHWAAYDVPRHLWHFSQKSISNLFAKKNMKVVKIKPMLFDAFYVSLLSEKYKNKSMNPIKAFFIGVRSNLKAKRSGEYSSIIYIIKNS